MTRRQKVRDGFTIIELLVVMAVISILLVLLLPAVQQARATARCVQCKNHLRQLGLALHNYHDSHRVFPAGSYILSALPKSSGWGWGAMVLPQLEQGPLFDGIDFNVGTAEGGNPEVIEQKVPTWVCPSDIAPDTITVRYPDAISTLPDGTVVVTPSDKPPVRVAAGNYVGVEGLLSPMSRVRLAKVSDGLSQTLMLGERVYQQSGDAEFSSCWCGRIAWDDLHVSNCIPHLAALADRPINTSLNAPQYFSSRHDGGVHFALADGSVHFLNDSIDGKVFEALGTPDGGERATIH